MRRRERRHIVLWLYIGAIIEEKLGSKRCEREIEEVIFRQQQKIMHTGNSHAYTSKYIC